MSTKRRHSLSWLIVSLPEDLLSEARILALQASASRGRCPNILLYKCCLLSYGSVETIFGFYAFERAYLRCRKGRAMHSSQYLVSLSDTCDRFVLTRRTPLRCPQGCRATFKQMIEHKGRATTARRDARQTRPRLRSNLCLQVLVQSMMSRKAW